METPEQQAERIEKWRQETTALVFLEAYGSQSHLDKPWAEHAYTVTGAPEFLGDETWEINGYEIDHDDCMTVLSCHVGDEPDQEKESYRLVYSYGAGGRDCPECDGWEEHQKEHPEDQGKPCPLCEGYKYLYWGEEWQVCVYAPIPRPKHWIAGSGQLGCLYDGGPDVYNSKEDAIEGLAFRFDHLSKRTLDRMRKDLVEDHIHYFDRRLRRFAGASYCEIDECDCMGHDHPESDDE